MTVKAWLEGHEFDLHDLAELLSSGDIQVVREGDDHYLTAPEIDNPPETNRFDKPAERLIVRINGLGRAKSADFRPVKLRGKYTDSNGNEHHFLYPPAAEIRMRAWAAGVVTTSDGTIVPDPPSPWPDRFSVAEGNSDVAEALEIMGHAAEPLGWDDLWKLFEIIREAIKPDNIVGMGWTTQADLDSFKESANHPDVSGEEARHARRREQPQHRKMSLAEGRSFVSDRYQVVRQTRRKRLTASVKWQNIRASRSAET